MRDNYLTPSLTNEGISMLIRSMNGEKIKFTKLSFGDGTPNNVTNIKNLSTTKLTIGISDFEKKDDYIILTGYCNSSQIEESFYAKELGVYAEDENKNEKLYAYRYTDSEVDFFPALSTGRSIEMTFSVIVQIGNAENVSAILVESDAYAGKEDFKKHCEERNPHKTTANDVGAAPKTHGHNVSDLTGILPVEKGGTGAGTYEELVEKMSKSGALGIPVFGTYTGDGTQGRVITLGFKPYAVILCDNYGNFHDDINGYTGGIAIGAYGCCSQRGTVANAESWNSSYTTMMIVDNGFKVNYYPDTKVYSNADGRTYRYIAFR